MNSAIERLLSLRVEDIMNEKVVQISNNSTMSDAAQLLMNNDVTGAPVVDDTGRCVGVLSTTDFAVRDHYRASYRPVAIGDQSSINAVNSDDRVADHMSPLVQTIGASAPIMNAARAMCREHIHRLVIVDADQHPIGIISALDIVATMVAAIEE